MKQDKQKSVSHPLFRHLTNFSLRQVKLQVLQLQVHLQGREMDHSLPSQRHQQLQVLLRRQGHELVHSRQPSQLRHHQAPQPQLQTSQWACHKK